MNNHLQQAPARPCPHCGASEIVRDIKVQKNVESGWVGLDYKALGPLRGTEPLLADLCLNSGMICRLHVKNTAHKW